MRASWGVLHIEEGLCDEEDGGIGDSYAKSKECIKPTIDIMRAVGTVVFQVIYLQCPQSLTGRENFVTEMHNAITV